MKERSRLVVERVDTIQGRPWTFVSGHLRGEPIRVGDTVTLEPVEGEHRTAVVQAVELHTKKGVTTVAIDLPIDGPVDVGTAVVLPV